MDGENHKTTTYHTRIQQPPANLDMKKTILDSLAATQTTYNARVIPVPKEEQRVIEKYISTSPEKIETTARKTLIAEKENGGLAMPDLESRIKACDMEKIVELKRLKEQTEFGTNTQYSK